MLVNKGFSAQPMRDYLRDSSRFKLPIPRRPFKNLNLYEIQLYTLDPKHPVLITDRIYSQNRS